MKKRMDEGQIDGLDYWITFLWVMSTHDLADGYQAMLRKNIRPPSSGINTNVHTLYREGGGISYSETLVTSYRTKRYCEQDDNNSTF
jgi:hypothetical protein